MLIDFDYAAFLTDSKSDSDGQFSLGNRTVCLFITNLQLYIYLTSYNVQGTTPFMSWSILMAESGMHLPVKHRPVHDIESIFYVMLYFCMQFKGPGIRHQKDSRRYQCTEAIHVR